MTAPDEPIFSTVHVFSEVNGKKYKLRLKGSKNSILIAKVRKALAGRNATSVPVEQQILSHKGELLHDSQSLAEVGIHQPTDLIVLTSRMRPMEHQQQQVAPTEQPHIDPQPQLHQRHPTTPPPAAHTHDYPHDGYSTVGHIPMATTPTSVLPPPAAVHQPTSGSPVYHHQLPPQYPLPVLPRTYDPIPLAISPRQASFGPADVSKQWFGEGVRHTVQTPQHHQHVQGGYSSKATASTSTTDIAAMTARNELETVTPKAGFDADQAFWVQFLAERKKYKVPVNGDMGQITVGQIKEYIESSAKVPKQRQILSYEGVVLEDDQTAGDFDIVDGAVLHLNVTGMVPTRGKASVRSTTPTATASQYRQASPSPTPPTPTPHPMHHQPGMGLRNESPTGTTKPYYGYPYDPYEDAAASGDGLRDKYIQEEIRSIEALQQKLMQDAMRVRSTSRPSTSPLRMVPTPTAGYSNSSIPIGTVGYAGSSGSSGSGSPTHGYSTHSHSHSSHGVVQHPPNPATYVIPKDVPSQTKMQQKAQFEIQSQRLEEERRRFEEDQNRLRAEKAKVGDFFSQQEKDFSQRERELEEEKRELIRRREMLLNNINVPQHHHHPSPPKSPPSPITIDVTAGSDDYGHYPQQQQHTPLHALYSHWPN